MHLECRASVNQEEKEMDETTKDDSTDLKVILGAPGATAQQILKHFQRKTCRGMTFQSCNSFLFF